MNGQPPSCKGCPLYGVGTGFVLGSGNPVTAKIALLLEAPGKNELIWDAEPDEIARRIQRYPELEGRYIRLGVPVVGKAGFILWNWALAPLQIHRKDTFVDNTLRCLPPKIKNAQYPTGEVKKAAEAWCSQYSIWYDKAVFVLQCKACGKRELLYDTNMPMLSQTLSRALGQKRGEPNTEESKDILLQSVFSSALVKQLSKAPQMQVCWVREGIPGSSAVWWRPDSETEKLLHAGLLHSPSNEAANFYSRDHSGEADKESSSPSGSQIPERRVHFCQDSSQETLGNRTSTSNGEDIRATVETLGVSSSQKRSENGQSSKELGSCSNAQPLWKNPVSFLQQIFYDSLTKCSCGGEALEIKGSFVAGFNPTCSIVQIHPAAIGREPTPLPLMLKTFEKAKDFAAEGERPVVLCGGKAVQAWMGHGSTVQTWLGHYESETPLSASNRGKRREMGMATKTTKEPKVKKLTARTALALLVSEVHPVLTGDGMEVGQQVSTVLTGEQYREILALIEGKPKKEGKKRVPK